MEDIQSLLKEAFDVAVKIMEEGRNIEEKGKNMVEIGGYLRSVIDIFKGRSSFNEYSNDESVGNKKILFPKLLGSSRTSIFKEDDLKYIRHRTDGRYEYRRMFNGENYHCINKDRQIVRKFASTINRKIKNLINGLEEESNITFYDYAVNFFNLYKVKKIKASTIAEYEAAHKLFKEKLNKPFRNLRADDFQKFLNSAEEEHPTTALKLYNKIKAICKRAYVEGVITKNIGEILSRPDVTYGVRRALTLNEQKAFLEKLKSEPKDVYTFCLFCLITSARREEASKLKPEHLNEKDGTLFISGTKTLNAPRTIKVTKSFIELLHKINFKFPHSADYYSRVAKSIFTEIGSKDLTLNCLRHTCSTNMVYLGIPPDYRKHIMGHSTILTTDRVYTHIDAHISKQDILDLYKDLYFTDF